MQKKKKDFDDIMHLAGVLYPEVTDIEKRRELLKKAFKDETVTMFVAEADEKVVGYVKVVAHDEFAKGGRIDYAENLFVMKEYREKGVGKVLMKKVIQNAQEHGSIQIKLITRIDEQNTPAFYEGLGFVKGNAVYMKKNLEK